MLDFLLFIGAGYVLVSAWKWALTDFHNENEKIR